MDPPAAADGFRLSVSGIVLVGYFMHRRGRLVGGEVERLGLEESNHFDPLRSVSGRCHLPIGEGVCWGRI
jgi:hypothetical protein